MSASNQRASRDLLDERAAVVLDDVERLIADLGTSPDVSAVRSAYDLLAERHGLPVKPVASVTDREVPAEPAPVPVRIWRPAGSGLFPIIVYLHGGGGVAGGIATAAGACSTLATVCNALVVAPEYRLAPESPFPAGLDDAESVVRWCMSQAAVLDGDAERVALVGEGWGASLAVGLSTRLAQGHGLPLAMQLLIDPVLAPLSPTTTYEQYGAGFGVEPRLIARCRDWYRGDEPADRWSAWTPSPAGPVAVPPTLVVTSECDPFRDDSEDYVKLAAAGGSMAALRRCQGLIHGSVVTFGGTVFRGRMALEQMARALRLGLRTGWEPLLALEA